MDAAKNEFSTEAYEAQLDAEVEKLKLGDRVEDDQAEGTTAAPATAADAASHTATDDDTSASSSSPTAAPSTAATSVDDPALSSTAPLTIEEIVEKDSLKSLEAKKRGNEFYARQQFEQALEEYTQAIALCPCSEEEGATPEDLQNLSVYYSNRAAVYLMQQRYEEVVSDCTSSLDLHPTSLKPLLRRSKAFESLDRYPEAIEDLKKVVEIDPSDQDSTRQLARLEKELAEKNEKMKEEMMGKLKEFGNTILGKFGMSLDNFKATKDPNTGSYNISFGK